MSNSDLVNTIGILANMSKFPQLADRLQQGMLNGLYLGRLLDNDAAHGGFVSDPAFRVDDEGPVDGTNPPVIDTSRLYYNGNSQGAIFGGGLTAVSPDFTRASLGVGGMNYSVLLNRSVDFDDLRDRPRPGLPGRAQPAAGPLDGPDALGPRRVERLRAPDHRQPAAEHPAARDPDEHRLRRPSGHQLLGRHDGSDDRHGADPYADRLRRSLARCRRRLGPRPDDSITRYTSGSALVYWDSGPIRDDPDSALAGGRLLGTNAPPIANIPNRPGSDPHELPRRTAGGAGHGLRPSCSRTRRATSPIRVPGRPASTSRSAVLRAR